MERGLSDKQWTELGATLKRIHTTAPTPDLAGRMRRETFAPVGGPTIDAVNRLVEDGSYEGPAAHELATFWRSRQVDIQTVLRRATVLSRQLARKGLPLTLCHADIHTNNIMLDADGQVWIVDWDETVLAPKERDLMFVVGGGISRALVGPRDEELFRQGYGETGADPLTLTYYRYARAVEDIGAFGEQVFFRPDLGADSKRTAVEYFQSLFLPGNIVDLAIGSDEQAIRFMRGGGRG
jgi:spectinomycin phosphotransferase